MSWNVRIGINPISWSNDDLPALGGETPLETALREGAEIGYQGFELGNKFPKEPAALAAKQASAAAASAARQGAMTALMAAFVVPFIVSPARCAAARGQFHSG